MNENREPIRFVNAAAPEIMKKIDRIRVLQDDGKGDDMPWDVLTANFTSRIPEHCIIYGKAGDGKTTVMMNILVFQQKKYGGHTLLFVPEEFSSTHVTRKLMHIYAGKSVNQMSENEYLETRDWVGKNFTFIEAPRLGVYWEDLRHTMTKFVSQYNGRVNRLVIDHALMLEKKEAVHEDNIRYLINEIINTCDSIGVFAWIANHVVKPTFRFHKESGRTFVPPMHMEEMAHGLMWSRFAYNIIEVYRPDDEVYGTRPNETWLNVRKVKNEDVGNVQQQIRIFFNPDTKQFSEKPSSQPF